jgi:nicotinamidase-related amidase
MSTRIGVESTARQAALSLGYEIAFATNGMSDLVQGAHDNRVRTTFPRVGRLDTAANIIAALPSIE